MSLYEDTREHRPISRVWRGHVSRNVANVEERLFFFIDDFDELLEMGPARWQARADKLSNISPSARAAITSVVLGSSSTLAELQAATSAAINSLRDATAAALEEVRLPMKGDDCLVIFDNEMEPWVIWWPYD